MDEFIALLPKLASVFGLAFVSMWAAAALGFAMNVNPIVIWLVSCISYTAGVVLIVLIGKPIREKLLARLGSKAVSNPNSAIRRAWDRYGLLGLSLIAPFTTGAQIGAAIGLSLGIPPRKLTIGMSLGGALWGAFSVIAVLLGIMGVQAVQ